MRNRERICLKMGKRDRLGYFIHGHGVWGFFEKVKRRTHKQEANPASDGFQTQNEPEPLQQSRIGDPKVHILRDAEFMWNGIGCFLCTYRHTT